MAKGHKMRHVKQPDKKQKNRRSYRTLMATVLVSVSIVSLAVAMTLAYYTLPCLICGEKFCLGDCPVEERVPAGDITGINRDEHGALIYPTVLE